MTPEEIQELEDKVVSLEKEKVDVRKFLEEAMGSDVCGESGNAELVAILTSQRDNARNAEDALTPKTDLAKLQMVKKLLMEVSASRKKISEDQMAKYGDLSYEERWSQTNNSYLWPHLKHLADGHISHYIKLVEEMK